MRQLDFRLVHTSGEEPDELLEPSLLVHKAWISDKKCEFPQDLVLQLRRESHVERIEILCHSAFIPERIEVNVGGSSPQDKWQNIEFRTLGEVVLKENRKSGVHKQELKTIFLDEQCSFLWLKVAENYADPTRNEFDQVGLESVKVLGDYTPNAVEADFKPLGGTSREGRRKSEDNGDRGYSTEIQKLLHIVEKNQGIAVSEKDFKLAREAQVATRTLKKAKVEMEELERDKDEAVGEEDFHRAEDLVEEMKTLRGNILAAIDRRLLEERLSFESSSSRPTSRKKSPTTGEGPFYTVPMPKLFTPVDLSPSPPLPRRPPPEANQVPPSRTSSRRRRSLPKPTSEVYEPLLHEDASKPPSRRSTISSSSSTSFHRPSTTSSSKTRNKFLEKENMIVPAVLKNRRASDPAILPSPEASSLSFDDEGLFLSSIHSQDRAAASFAIAHLGFQPVQKVYSKRWETRREGLEEVKRVLEETPKGDNADQRLEAALHVLSRCLRDSLFNVYSSATDLLRFVTETYVVEHGLQSKMATRVATATADPLVSRTGDTTDKRFAPLTLQTAADILRGDPKVARAFLQRFLQPLKTSGSKSDQGRAHIVWMALRENSAPNKELGLTEKPVGKFAVSCMSHSDAEVRNTGRNIFLHMYERGDKDSLRPLLPDRSRSNANNSAFRRLFEDMDRLDGRRQAERQKY